MRADIQTDKYFCVINTFYISFDVVRFSRKMSVWYNCFIGSWWNNRYAEFWWHV